MTENLLESAAYRQEIAAMKNKIRQLERENRVMAEAFEEVAKRCIPFVNLESFTSFTGMSRSFLSEPAGEQTVIPELSVSGLSAIPSEDSTSKQTSLFSTA